MRVPPSRGQSVAVVHDDESARVAIGSLLQTLGFAVEGFASAEDLLGFPRLDEMACMIVDIRMPRMGGADQHRRLVERHHRVPAIFFSAHDDAAERRAADDANALGIRGNPSAEQFLIAAVESAIAGGRGRSATASPCVDDAFSKIVGKNDGLRLAVQQARRFATVNTPLLIQGETGVGKEVFARSIDETGRHGDAPFIALNCGGLPRDLLASELFGYVDGAFTGARRSGMVGKIEGAQGGTLFLDEIAEMPVDLQPYLLRVLEGGEVYPLGSNHPRIVRFRLIAACNQDLLAEVDAGRFRMDLFFRIAATTLAIPALRERAEDISALVAQLALETGVRHGVPVKSFDPAVMTVFEHYPWPGNVRELRNVVEAMMLLSESDVVGLDALPATLAVHQRGLLDAVDAREPPEGMERVQRDAIDAAIRRRRGNLTQVARDLCIAKSTLYEKMKKYTLHPVVDAVRHPSREPRGTPPAGRGPVAR